MSLLFWGEKGEVYSDQTVSLLSLQWPGRQTGSKALRAHAQSYLSTAYCTVLCVDAMDNPLINP